MGVKALQKQLVFNSLTDGADLPKKIEGIALLDDKHVALINDNDFAIKGNGSKVHVLELGQKLGQSAGLSIGLNMIGRYASNTFDASAAEILAFHHTSGRIFVANAKAGAVD